MKAKRVKMTVALWLAMSLLLGMTSAFASSSGSTTPSYEEILLNYQDEVRSLQASPTQARSIDVNKINQLRNERDSALIEAGYDVYRVDSSTIAAVENTLDTDLTEIGLDDGGSYLIVIGGEQSSVARGSAGTQYTYTYNGVTYTMRNFVVTADDAEASSGFAQSSSVNVLQSSTTTLIQNALDTAISAYVSSVSNLLGTVASICGLSISSFAPSTQATLNLNAGSNWTRVFTQVYSTYDKSWWYGSCVEYVYCYSYMSGTYYKASTNQMTAVPTNASSKYVYSSNYGNSTWMRQQAAIAFSAGSPCKYNTTGAVYYTYGGTTKITHYENF